MPAIQNEKQGTIKVYVETTGCAVNRAYGEYLLGLLRARGYEIVNSPAEADVIIYNGCAIKKPTEDRARSRLAELREISLRKGSKIIVAGCLAQAVHKRVKKVVPEASLIGVYHIYDIPNLLPEIIEGKQIELRSFKHIIPHGFPRILESKLIATVPIAQGCLGECTFCIDRLIWGRLRSFPLDRIIEEIKKLVKLGVKEIRLSGQDTGPYGWDLGITLADLLESISSIEGDFRIRIGMASPDTFMRIVDDVLDVMKKDKRFYRYLHLPVQSGSNRILQLMKRKYTAEEFIELVDYIRKKLGEDTTIATDIIVAFPTETEEDHQKTIELLERVKPDIVNISRYGDRPGIPASKIYPKVHSGVAKRRTVEIANIVMRISYKKNKRYLNRMLEVLFLEQSDSRILGRTYNYRIVSVEAPNEILGKTCKVIIKDVTWKTLYGDLIKV